MGPPGAICKIIKTKTVDPKNVGIISNNLLKKYVTTIILIYYSYLFSSKYFGQYFISMGNRGNLFSCSIANSRVFSFASSIHQ